MPHFLQFIWQKLEQDNWRQLVISIFAMLFAWGVYDWIWRSYRVDPALYRLEIAIKNIQEETNCLLELREKIARIEGIVETLYLANKQNEK